MGSTETHTLADGPEWLSETARPILSSTTLTDGLMVIAETQMASSLMDYNEEDVHLLFSSLGFPQYEQQIHEHGITGDILQALDHDTLKEVGVSSVGQRLVILKAVYNLKIRDGIPIEADHYVPPCQMIPCLHTETMLTFNFYTAETADIPADKLTLSQLHNHISQLGIPSAYPIAAAFSVNL